MIQPNGVRITEIFTTFITLILYMILLFPLSIGTILINFNIIVWLIGYWHIWKKTYNFFEWNFKPENYEIEKIEEAN